MDVVRIPWDQLSFDGESSSLIGRGTFGAVYKASWRPTKSTVRIVPVAVTRGGGRRRPPLVRLRLVPAYTVCVP